MKHQTTLFKRKLIRTLTAIFVLFLCSNLIKSQVTSVFYDDFEGDWTSDWHADAGTWEVGVPTSGPNEAHSPTKCAATILAGNYTTSVNSRLIRHTSFIVPELNKNPRLRIWHWYSFSSGDYGYIQLKIDGTTDWINISPKYINTGGNVWTYPSIDLSDYAGMSVQIAFFFHSDTYSNSTGWYIDDLRILSGLTTFNTLEGWENGIGDWSSEKGTWQVGIPNGGPGEAYSGDYCIATNLDGSYTTSVSSKLISPYFMVPNANEMPRLRFQHWYSFSSGDYGYIQLKIDGTTDWINISPKYINTGGNVWTYPSIDLSDYAGMSVQIAFFFHSDTYSNSTGWYIDDLRILSGLTTFNTLEGWENGIGDWSSEKGTWQVGIPNGGPGEAYSGDYCIATNLDGSYTTSVSSKLISPYFMVPNANEMPRLRFQHWYSFSSGDYGYIQLKIDGTTDWINMSPKYTNTGGNIWTYPSIDLSEYEGQKVQIALYFHSDTYSNSTGWYIDNLELITRPVILNNPEDWENGIGDYISERGTWEVGIPLSGPENAYSGLKCAATIIDGNYTTSISSKLISPVFTVPEASENPVLRFRHWYSFSSGDYAKVLIKIEGSSDWEDVENGYFTQTGGNIWTYPYLPILNYAGESVRIAFYFYSDTYSNSLGWYIDDIVIEGLATGIGKTNETSVKLLKQNTPNPFSSNTEITYKVEQICNVNLKVYNSNGQLVESVINKVQSPGEYTIDFSASKLSSGIYYYQLQLGDSYRETKKMVKL